MSKKDSAIPDQILNPGARRLLLSLPALWQQELTGAFARVTKIGNKYPGAHLSPPIMKYVIWIAIMWHRALTAQGVVPSERGLGESLANYDNMLLFVQHQRASADTSTGRRTISEFTLGHRLYMLHRIARITIGPNEELLKLARETLKAAKKATKKAVRSTIDLRELLFLGGNLILESQRVDDARRRAIIFRNGLIILFCYFLWLRPRTFAALDVTRNFIRRGNDFLIVIFPDQIKEKNVEGIPIPKLLDRLLAKWIDIHGPALMSRGDPHRRCPLHRFLWVSWTGKPLGQMSITNLVAKITTNYLHVAVRPNLVRRSGATALSVEPAAVARPYQLLLQIDEQTSAKNYIQPCRCDALVEYQKLLEKHIRDTSHELLSNVGDGEDQAAAV